MSRRLHSADPTAQDSGSTKGERTRAHIIELAAAQFADFGFKGSSLNEVIRRSGLTKGAFYFHFKSKEELALRVFRSKQAELVARVRAESRQKPDAIEQLRELLHARARLLRDEPAFRGFLKLASELVVIYGPGSEYAMSYGVATRVFADLVRRGQREGVIRKDVDPAGAAEFIFSALLGADELSKAISGGKDLVGRTEKLLDFIVAGLRPEETTTQTKQQSARRKRK